MIQLPTSGNTIRYYYTIKGSFASVSVSGTMKGIQIQEMITFIGTPATEKGVINGVGKGVIMAAADGGGEVPEMVTYAGEGVGRFSSSGSIKWRGSVFFGTSSAGSKLAFLNNMMGVFESEIDADGNFSEKEWEWK
jgi:hypothetical protein